MKKVLLIILIGLIVATGASYFGMQWKIRKSLDDFFQSMPFVEGSYDRFTIDVNGRMSIKDIVFYIPMADLSIDISSVSLTTGSLWETLSLEKKLKAGQLPRVLKVEFNSFAMDIERDLVDSMAQMPMQTNVFSEITALGCGRNVVLGPVELYDLGLKQLTFDLSLGYHYNSSLDELVSDIDVYMDGIGHFVYDQTTIGLYSIMDNFNNAMFNFDPSSITTNNVHFQYTDLGYNAKVVEFCAAASGMEKSQWLTLHKNMVNSAMTQIDLETDFDYMQLYDALISDRVQLDISLIPLSGFSVADLQFYSVADLIELVSLKVNVNNDAIDIGQVRWNKDKLASIDLNAIRKEFRVSNSEEQETDQSSNDNAQSRMLVPVPATQLGQYMHRTALIERTDGRKFIGEIFSVTADRVVIRTRFSGGFTDLPLTRSEVKSVKIYPED